MSYGCTHSIYGGSALIRLQANAEERKDLLTCQISSPTCTISLWTIHPWSASSKKMLYDPTSPELSSHRMKIDFETRFRPALSELLQACLMYMEELPEMHDASTGRALIGGSSRKSRHSEVPTNPGLLIGRVG